MAAVCPGGSTVPATVMIVVEYRLVYQLIGRSQAAKACSGGSTVPAAVVIVVKYRTCLSVGRLIVGVQARLVGRWIVCISARLLSVRRRIGTAVVSFVGHRRLGRT
jgi:hypothetical protein